jgi:hypothetical protein
MTGTWPNCRTPCALPTWFGLAKQFIHDTTPPSRFGFCGEMKFGFTWPTRFEWVSANLDLIARTAKIRIKQSAHSSQLCRWAGLQPSVAHVFDLSISATVRKEKRMVHAVGDGTFIVDGRRIDRKKMMTSKLPPGV